MSTEARTSIIWLHGLGDLGFANKCIKNLFTSPEFTNTRWSFPNSRLVMQSWSDILKFRVTGGDKSTIFTCFGKYSSFMKTYGDKSSSLHDSPEVSTGLLDSVKLVHELIDAEVASGTDPRNIFVCGVSQGGALIVASVLLYPQTLGGAAVLSGWIPSNASLLQKTTPEAKKTPMLWCHGTKDAVIKFDAGKSGQRFLKKAGIKCEFKVYPGKGHRLLDEELLYLGDWIKSRLGTSS